MVVNYFIILNPEEGWKILPNVNLKRVENNLPIMLIYLQIVRLISLLCLFIKVHTLVHLQENPSNIFTFNFRKFLILSCYKTLTFWLYIAIFKISKGNSLIQSVCGCYFGRYKIPLVAEGPRTRGARDYSRGGGPSVRGARLTWAGNPSPSNGYFPFACSHSRGGSSLCSILAAFMRAVFS